MYTTTPKAIMLAIVALLSVAACVATLKPSQIELRSRSIPLTRGIEPALAEILKAKRTANVHSIVQFKKGLRLDQHQQLIKEGIQLQSYLGGNAYIAAISPQAPLAKT